MPDRVEELAADRGQDLGEVGRDDLVERSAGRPAGDTACLVGRVHPDVDGADRVVVRVARQVLPDLGLPLRLVRHLDAEADVEPAVRPARGGVADLALARRERRERVGGGARVEVEVVGDGDLGDAPFDRRGAVGVDRRVAVGREVRVEVRVERQVAIGLRPR